MRGLPEAAGGRVSARSGHIGDAQGSPEEAAGHGRFFLGLIFFHVKINE